MDWQDGPEGTQVAHIGSWFTMVVFQPECQCGCGCKVGDYRWCIHVGYYPDFKTIHRGYSKDEAEAKAMAQTNLVDIVTEALVDAESPELQRLIRRRLGLQT